MTCVAINVLFDSETNQHQSPTELTKPSVFEKVGCHQFNGAEIKASYYATHSQTVT